MKTYLIILTYLFWCYQVSSAQHSISGNLIAKDTKEAIPFANVMLHPINSDSVVNFTGSALDGNFVLTDVSSGYYRLHIDFIGLDPLTIDSLAVYKNLNLGSIGLKRAVALGEIVINTKKPNAELKLDRKTFSVADNPINEGGNATEVLSNLPSVDVDQDGNISLRGSSELRILIDGKPTGLRGDDIGVILSQIPANSIKDIEIITVPTAKYDAESAGGIINIMLKENKSKGTSGNLNISYGNYDKVNFSSLVGIKKEKISVNLSYGLKTGTYTFDRFSLTQNESIDTLDKFTIIAEGTNENIAHLGKANISLKLGEKSEIGSNTVMSVGRLNNLRITDYLWEFNSVDDELTIRDAKTVRSKLNMVNSLFYTRKLKNDGKLSLSSTYARSRSGSVGDFTESSITQEENNDLAADEYTQNLDITLPLKKINWEFGSQFTHRKIKNDFLYQSSDVQFTPIENNFDYFDNITAVYLMPSFSLKSWDISAGYRLEHTYSDSKNSSTNLDIQRDYFMHFPSFNLSKKIGEKNEFGLNYSRRITRPNARQLNPSVSLADPYSLRAGNPDITPATNDVSEITWLRKTKKITLQSTLFYQLRKNRVRRIRFVDDKGVSTVQWVNYNGEDYYGFEVFSSFKIHKVFTTNVSANIYERITDGSNISEDFTARYYGWDGKINFSLKLPKKFLLAVKAEYNSPKEIVIGTINARYHMDVVVQKKIMKNRGKISIRLADIFNTKQFQIETTVDDWNQSGTYKRESRILFISFNFNFGEIQKPKKSKTKNLRQNN